MYRNQYGNDNYDKTYDLIELIYLLNRLSNNSYIDESSKKYLIGMLDDVESLKYNFDKYREDDFCGKRPRRICNNCDGCYSNNGDSFLDRIIFFLKTLNN